MDVQSQQHFDLIYNVRFRNLCKKYISFVGHLQLITINDNKTSQKEDYLVVVIKSHTRWKKFQVILYLTDLNPVYCTPHIIIYELLTEKLFVRIIFKWIYFLHIVS